jgi:hypothetical protein
MAVRSFDLNIEEVLENWEVEHALREIIANAIDEQLISSTREIEIVRDAKGAWHVRDFGRGLRIEHFTQNENQEKLKSIQGVIGKFGVGLKDALATFHRRGIGVQIRSRFGTFRLKQEHKHGFQNIQTLHVEYDDNGTDFEGTDFVFSGVTDVDVSRAKSLFLRFAGEELLETNPYGQILKRNAASARVYILGVLAAEEPNFLFSYNLTNLTETMKKRLNRERLHVGRTTYADRVRAILKSSAAESVKIALVNEVQNRAIGQSCDEMGWIEISQKALTLMHERRNVAYLTERELHTSPGMLDAAKRDGYQVVVITDHQKAKLTEQAMAGGTQVRTLDAFVQQYNASFEYKFVGLAELTQVERSVFERTDRIVSLLELPSGSVPKVRISETIRMSIDDTEGCWDPTKGVIVIKRSTLSSVERYAAVLLHEVAHAVTGTDDATRDFENVLTGYLGKLAKAALR